MKDGKKILLRVTPDEKERIDDASWRARLSTNEWIRQQLQKVIEISKEKKKK